MLDVFAKVNIENSRKGFREKPFFRYGYVVQRLRCVSGYIAQLAAPN